jgi:O-antigen ligase/polysaccharide polymerase Wzy-like membrane protein
MATSGAGADLRTFFGDSAHDPAAIAIVGALALLSVGVSSGHGAGVLAILLAAVTLLAVAHRSILRWDRMVTALLIVVLFVPIGRFKLPAVLPFDLELYRIVVAILLLLWLTTLLIDSRVQLQRTPFDRPVFLIIGCTLASEVTNPGRVTQYGSHVVKSLMFFVSFVLLYYLIAATIRRREDLLLLLKILTLGGASIGALAVYELRTHYNLFDHVPTVLPFLIPQFAGDYHLGIGGNIRAVGPSQHPIALGAALILILPLAVHFARTSGRRWWFAAVLLILGAFASGSRTAIIMLVVVGIVFLWLKPVETKRLWPVLVPAVVVIHFAVPGQLGNFYGAFFPKGGLIAQQSRLGANYDPLLAGGRIRLLKPMLSEASQKPLFGDGVGTRLTGFNTPDRNSPILDDQWLGLALEVGFIGLAAWAWLFVGAVRRLANASRTAIRMGDDWLFAALAASVASCAVGMFTFDAFDFTQVPFIFWILLGVSAVLLSISKTSPTLSGPATERLQA